jgi:hypothetical protein
MAQEIKRLYSMADSTMLEKASVMHSAFESSLVDFTAYTTIFDQIFADDWMAEIMLALQTPTAEQVDDMGSTLTQAVLEKMADCRKAYRGISFFVREAFENQLGIQNEFGFDDYKDARNKQVTMIYFMQRLHKTAEKYETQLLAAGCPQSRIDELQTLADELFAANVEQEAFLDSRLDATAARITILNSVWKQMTRVSEAGKVIYSDNYAEYQKYVIYGSSSPVDNEEVFEGVLQAGETLEVFNKPYSSTRSLLLGNPGNFPVEYFLSENGVDPVGMVVVANPGDSLVYEQGSLGATGNLLMVRNTDLVNIAEYNVTVDESS